MSDGDEVADGGAVVVGEVDDDIVLEITGPADPDGLNIAAQDGSVKHAGVWAEHHVATDGSASGDKGGGGQIGFAP